jgi:hypothetical protein
MIINNYEKDLSWKRLGFIPVTAAEIRYLKLTDGYVVNGNEKQKHQIPIFSEPSNYIYGSTVMKNVRFFSLSDAILGYEESKKTDINIKSLINIKLNPDSTRDIIINGNNKNQSIINNISDKDINELQSLLQIPVLLKIQPIGATEISPRLHTPICEKAKVLAILASSIKDKNTVDKELKKANIISLPIESLIILKEKKRSLTIIPELEEN